MNRKESVIRHFGFGLGLAGALCVFVFVTVAQVSVLNPFVYFIWVGFIPLMIYFPHGKHRKFQLYLEMFCSFILGLGWGWLSNVIADQVANQLLGHVLDHLVMMFLIFWVSMTLLRKTPFNNLSMSFFGYAMINGCFGRPLPYLGIGFMGQMPPLMMTLLLIGYVVFGLLLCFCIEVLSDLFCGWLLKPNRETIAKWSAANEVPIEKLNEFLKHNMQ